MDVSSAERRDAWISIAIFLVITTLLSSVAHYAITRMRPCYLQMPR